MKLYWQEALQKGKERLLSKTGYLHWCSYAKEEKDHISMIPIKENIDFALLLLRTKEREHIKEAEQLLDRIFSFQIQDKEHLGLFPFFIHQYPICYDVWIGVKLLPTLFWICLHFTKVFPNCFQEKLKKVVSLLVEATVKRYHQKIPFFIAFQVGAIAKAFGKMWENTTWMQIGEDILEQRQKDHDPLCLYMPSRLAEIVLAMQMIEDDMPSSLSYLWKFLEEGFDRQTRSYIGPSFFRSNDVTYHAPTLYEYYFASHFQCTMLRKTDDLSLLLRTGMIQGKNRPFGVPDKFLEKKVRGYDWKMFREDQLVCSCMGKQPNTPEEQFYGFFPLKLVWTEEEKYWYQLFSIEEDFDSVTIEKFCVKEKRVEIHYVLKEQKEEGFVLRLFCSYLPSLSLYVQNKKATLFSIGDCIYIKTLTKTIAVSFKVVPEDSQVKGRILLGNQWKEKQSSQNNFAHNWIIGLEAKKAWTVDVSKPKKVIVSLQIVDA